MPLTNLYQNFKHWTLNISFTLSNFSSLNKGSVCALYLLSVRIRRARFCSLNILSHSKPQHDIPNCKCERTRESYISFIAENGRYRFNLFITPSVRDILLAILAECERQLRNSLIVNPRKLNSFTFSMIVLFIMSCGISFSANVRW